MKPIITKRFNFINFSFTRYAGVRIGPVVRKDVMRASTMLEHEEKYACILAFDVKVRRLKMVSKKGNLVMFHPEGIYERVLGKC